MGRDKYSVTRVTEFRVSYVIWHDWCLSSAWIVLFKRKGRTFLGLNLNTLIKRRARVGLLVSLRMNISLINKMAPMIV